MIDNMFLRQLVLNTIAALRLEDVLRNSRRDYHAKTLDYVCLHRTKELTIKAYFLGNGVALGQNVVNPHDHAYNFSTFVLSGALANVNFYPDEGGSTWFEHTYATALRGEPSITFNKVVKLREEGRIYRSGQHYYLDHSQIHTIRAYSNDVVMLLFQYQTERTAERGTSLFLPDQTVPSLDGLYRSFTEDEMVAALRRLSILVGS